MLTGIRKQTAYIVERITYWSVPPLRCALFRCSDGSERTLQTLSITFTWAAAAAAVDSAVFGNGKCIPETLRNGPNWYGPNRVRASYIRVYVRSVCLHVHSISGVLNHVTKTLVAFRAC